MEWIAGTLFVLVCFLSGVVYSQLKTIKWLLETIDFTGKIFMEVHNGEKISEKSEKEVEEKSGEKNGFRPSQFNDG